MPRLARLRQGLAGQCQCLPLWLPCFASSRLFKPLGSKNLSLNRILNLVNKRYHLICLESSMNELRVLFFFRPHLWHVEVPKLGVQLELQLLATATATPDLSLVWGLHHSSEQHQISDPLSEVRDRTRILTDTSWIRFHWVTTGTPGFVFWSCF